jgi:hypothetical protein
MPQDELPELFCHVDENDRVLGLVTRQQAHANQDIIHRFVYLFITNRKDQLLIQQEFHQRQRCRFMGRIGRGARHVWRDLSGSSQTGSSGRTRSHRPTHLPQPRLIHPPHPERIFHIYQAVIDITPSNIARDEIEQITWVDITALADFIKINHCNPGYIQALERINLY